MSEEAAIREMIASWCVATNAPGEAGADGYTSFVTDDVINLPPHGERVDGKGALRTWTLDYTSADEWAIEWDTTDVVVASSGDMAYAVGSFKLKMRDPEGNLIEDRGKFLDTLEKQAGGDWKAKVIAFNSDIPLES